MDDSTIDRFAKHPLPENDLKFLLRFAAPPPVGHTGRRSTVREVLKTLASRQGVAGDDRDRKTVVDQLTAIGDTLGHLISSDQTADTAGPAVSLAAAHGNRGTFPTAQSDDLHAALVKIEALRVEARRADERRRRLEWLQMASALDNGPVRAGGYPAHLERFLSAAGESMYEYFPWVDFDLEEVPREAHDKLNQTGTLRQKFERGDLHFMLAPMDEDEVADFYCYKYSFRVVGALRDLEEITTASGTINVHSFKGRKLLVAPPGYSSFTRLAYILRAAGKGLNIEDEESVELITVADPSTMRRKAEMGAGLAVISDEYSAVGGSVRDFPLLDLTAPLMPGRTTYREPKPYTVKMRLLSHRGSTSPRFRAFEWVVKDLVDQEKIRNRAAAQS